MQKQTALHQFYPEVLDLIPNLFLCQNLLEFHWFCKLLASYSFSKNVNTKAGGIGLKECGDISY